jgi:eukaryotic-like serine/threonine-protein kinase
LAVNPCPTDAALALLGHDSLPAAGLDSLERHVDACPACQEKLDQLVKNDAGTERVLTALLPGADDPPQVPGFVIECELGRGATSVVYQARQPSLNRRVALKVVRSGPAAGSHERARWMREAKASSRVRHENVVRLYQVGDAGGWHYLVLELVPGGTLQRGLDIAFAPADGARLLATVAQAVAAIHREGLLHLDLKPSNILLDRPPDTPRGKAAPRVSDFGIASPWNDPDATATMTGSNGPQGTPRYMAPEQVAGDRKQIGPAADIYGLGAVFYHVLTGHPPFSATSIADLFAQIQNTEPVAPRRLNPAIPLDLETICLKCLQKAPGRRYASAEALADDLNRWILGHPIAARPVSLVERAWRACRRRPAVAALAASLVATLIAGFAGMFLLWRHAESQRGRAVADFKMMSDVLGEIVELNTGGYEIPKPPDSESVISSLQKTRERLLEVAAGRPDQIVFSRHLAVVNKRIGCAHMFENRWAEARPFLHESAWLWERVVRHDPLDRRARRGQVLTLWDMAHLAEKQGNRDEASAILRRAVDLAEELNASELGSSSICMLADTRRSLAQTLADRGDHEGARSLMAANRRMLAEVTVDAGDPKLVAWRVFAVFDDFELTSADSPLAVAKASGPAEAERSPAIGSGQLPVVDFREAERLPTERWAELAASVLHSAAAADATPARRAEAGMYFVGHLSHVAASRRHSGWKDLASRTAERMHALAKLLVTQYPGQASAHIAVGEAFSQLHKNAWQTDDRVAVERTLKLALDAALQALALDPQNAMAFAHVEARRRRLKDLTASR